MSVDSTQKLLDLFTAQFAPDFASSAVALVKAFFNRSIRYMIVKHPADAAAATALKIPVDIIDSSMGAILVNSVKILPAAALTGDPTNNAVINLEYNDGAGGASTVIATITTTASWSAQQAVALTVTSANARVPAGKQLMVNITKGGTGVVVPACTFLVDATGVT